ncbi:hypothetical protein TRFO_03289 [Tritrichomonas foetus]|uniref:Uncharacterized protein n=1 Tax=Tritrichomonas foetus TaxID=1144522 RepID=A0A1J4KQL8_9EUKA|nr:hypothetical protein TRFO_03289 [Tritrichomonas foetus]|eukprot:OHT13547.1 hypothetical protein TRFO_03289 [Tritrichomonas foetus]
MNGYLAIYLEKQTKYLVKINNISPFHFFLFMLGIDSLFWKLHPSTSSQVEINDAWGKLCDLYHQKSSILELITIYENSNSSFIRTHSLVGLSYCLKNLFHSLDSAEIDFFRNKITEFYLKETEEDKKVKSADIICFFLEKTKQTWTLLDTWIAQCSVDSPFYFNILLYYIRITKDSQLLLNKLCEGFRSNLKSQLNSLEILLYFAQDLNMISFFSEQIKTTIELTFTNNNPYFFSHLFKIMNLYYSKISSIFPIQSFIPYISNKNLSKANLVCLRDFVNNHLSDLNQGEVLNVFCQEIELSKYLFDDEFEDFFPFSEDLNSIIQIIPNDTIQQVISQLLSEASKPSTLTTIIIIESLVITKLNPQNATCEKQECYNILTNILKIDDYLCRRMTLDSLYELKDIFSDFFDISIIRFLCQFSLSTAETETNNNRYKTCYNLNLLMKFIHITNVSSFVNEICDFCFCFLPIGKEQEICIIFEIFNLLIQLYFPHMNEIIPKIYIILCNCIQSPSEDICCVSFCCLLGILYKNSEIFADDLNCFLNCSKNVYSIFFISNLLSKYPEKVSPFFQQNMAEIIQILETSTITQLSQITAWKTEIILFTFYKLLELLNNALKHYFMCLENEDDTLYPSIKVFTQMLFRQLSPDYLERTIPNFINLLHKSVQLDIYIYQILNDFAGNIRNPSHLLPFLEYSIKQIEYFFTNKTCILNREIRELLDSFCAFINLSLEIDQKLKYFNLIFQYLINFCFINLSTNMNSPDVLITCLQILIICEQKISFENDSIPIIIELISSTNDNVSDAAASFVTVMIQNNFEYSKTFQQTIHKNCIERLNNCNDQELAENLIFILISLVPDEFSLIKSILNHFQIGINTSLIQPCYCWLLSILNSLSEEDKLLAYRSIVQFVVTDIKDLFEEKEISIELLRSILSVISTIPQDIIQSSLNNNYHMYVFSSHIQYINSLLT